MRWRLRELHLQFTTDHDRYNRNPAHAVARLGVYRWWRPMSTLFAEARVVFLKVTIWDWISIWWVSSYCLPPTTININFPHAVTWTGVIADNNRYYIILFGSCGITTPSYDTADRDRLRRNAIDVQQAKPLLICLTLVAVWTFDFIVPLPLQVSTRVWPQSSFTMGERNY